MNHPKFLVKTDAQGKYRFNLTAKNGQVILSSQGYSSKSGCTNGIESVKKNGVDDDRYDRLEAKNGSFYFNLKAGNGEIIGSSEMYTTKAARDNGIESVKTNAPEAGIEEVSAS
ncbi:YegP family protein [bacterium]|nr:YegP family protein [bacterium]